MTLVCDIAVRWAFATAHSPHLTPEDLILNGTNIGTNIALQPLFPRDLLIFKMTRKKKKLTNSLHEHLKMAIGNTPLEVAVKFLSKELS